MSNQKKIAIIVPGGFGTGKNNQGVPVLEQLVKLLSAQLDVTVFQLYKVNDDYKVHGFRLLDFKSGNRWAQYFKFLFSFYKTNREKKFDAVHGFWVWPCGFLAVVLGKLFGIKSIVSVLGGDAASLPAINYGHLRKFFSRTMILWSLKHADESTSLTEYLAINLRQAGLIRKLKIIPWGVDQTLFHYQEKPLQRPVQFLHIANLHPVKDQETLLRAFDIIRQNLPSHLTIIGEGPEEQNLIQLIAQLKLQEAVTIRKQLSYEKLPAIYHQSDIVLHPSLAEGQSEVVTEAMSCGIVVAGTAVGLLHDFPENGIVVPASNYRGLAKAVLTTIQDEEALKNIRESAHRWARIHSILWTVERTIELY